MFLTRVPRACFAYAPLHQLTRSSIARSALFCILAIVCPPAPAQDSALAEKFRRATEDLQAGRLDSAGEGFAAVVAAQPSFAEAHLNLGLVREEQGRNDEAIANLKKALQLKPHLRGASLFLGIAQYRLNQFEQAAEAVRGEIRVAPNDANAWMWLGVVQLAEELPEAAAVSLDRAATLAPGNVDILYHRGRAHLLVSKDSYDKMFQADPNSWRVHQVLAQADGEADRHDEAIAEYQAAIQAVPQQPGLHEALGTEYWKAGKLDPAETALKQELQIDPNNAVARYKLGILEVERGEGAKSKELIEAAVQQNHSLKNSSYYLGRAEMELGNNDAAADAFRQAVSEKDAEPEIVQQAWYQLGIVYRRLHRIDDAQNAFASFQKLKDETSQRLQERLQKKRESEAAGPPPTSPGKTPK